MGFMNPYVGLGRDGTGYYLDYAEAQSSPYYKNGAGLSSANTGVRVDTPSFNPYGQADQQYASDQEVAPTAQEGRDQSKQAQLSSEIGYAQDAARRASVDQQQGGTTPGGPDVQLTTGGNNGDATDDEGGGGTRRRRGAYQGSGLKI